MRFKVYTTYCFLDIEANFYVKRVDRHTELYSA